MEVGLELRRASINAQRAGVRVRRRSGRSCSVSTRSGASFRPSATRFQAASKRSSASPAAPTRSSSVLAKTPERRLDVALEAVAQPVAQIVVQLDFEPGILEQYFFRQEQHMA